MPTRLILLAHAATTATRHARCPTASDSLEPGGERAARHAATRWPEAARILHSPTLAARQTALAMAPPAASSAPRADSALRDLDFGSWAGRSLDDIGPDVARWIADPSFDGHGGESIAALCGRIRGWLDGCLTVPGLTLAVSHAAVIRAAMLATLDAPPSGFWRVDVAPLSALALTSDGQRWALRALAPLGRRLFSASAR